MRDIAPPIPFVTLDLETIRAIPAAPGDDPMTFPPPPVHRIVCVGRAFVSMREDRPWARIVSVWSEDEAALVREVVKSTSDRSTLVTFNGRRFDLPVVNGACMRHRIAWPWFYYSHGARVRYSANSHVDIADELAEHGAASPASLDRWGQCVGIGRKTDSGSSVADMWEASEHDRIASYCGGDVRLTAALYLRWLLVRGDIDSEREAGLQQALSEAKVEIKRVGEL